MDKREASDPSPRLGVYLVAVPIAVARILWLMVQGSRSQRDCSRCRRDARLFLWISKGRVMGYEDSTVFDGVLIGGRLEQIPGLRSHFASLGLTLHSSSGEDGYRARVA